MASSRGQQSQSHWWLLALVLCSVVSFYFGRSKVPPSPTLQLDQSIDHNNDASLHSSTTTTTSTITATVLNEVLSTKFPSDGGNNNDYSITHDSYPTDTNNQLYSEPVNDATCARYHNKNFTYRRDDELIAGYAPPLLISYKGSGATYLRSLIELSTGYKSGSLGTNEGEKDLKKNEYFADDNTCQLMHSIVECPDPAAFRLSVNTIGNIFFIHKKHRVKCRQGSIYGFKRAVFLVRNPVHTILSSYLTSLRLADPTRPIDKVDLLKDGQWNAYFNHTATMWSQSWNATVYPLINYLVQGYSLIAIVRYEDLRSPATQLETLHSLVTFVINKPISRHQIQCALHITERRPSCLVDEIPPAVQNQLDNFPDHVNNVFKDPSYIQHLVQFTSNFSLPYYSLCPERKASDSADCQNIKREYDQLVSHSKGYIHDTAACVNERHGSRLFFPMDSVYEDLYFENHTEGQSYLEHIRYLEKLAIEELNAPKKEKKDKKADNHPDYSRMVFRYEGRNFSQLDPPPLLLSYPGSGNTWVRLLVEFSSGIFSGSIDAGDQQLQEGIAGERYCSPMNSVIKAHPININASATHKHVYLVDELHRLKCNLTHSFTHVLFLVRNPYHAILAEFHRSHTKSHHAVVEVGEISDAYFHKTAVALARHYMDTWTAIIEPMIQSLPRENIHVVKYESLVSQNVSERYQALGDVLRFLNYRHRNERFRQYQQSDTLVAPTVPGSSGHRQLPHVHHHQSGHGHHHQSLSPHAVADRNNDRSMSFDSTRFSSNFSDALTRRHFECAFRLSQNPKVHRKKSTKSYHAQHAYRDQVLVDAMWEFLAPFATYAGYEKKVYQ